MLWLRGPSNYLATVNAHSILPRSALTRSVQKRHWTSPRTKHNSSSIFIFFCKLELKSPHNVLLCSFGKYHHLISACMGSYPWVH
jgi:hypothetical protein